jgi:hypothetical protein
MNVKHEWINTFLIALTLSICLFIVVDIAYDERIWEFGTFTLKVRIQAVSVVVVTFYFYRRIARFSLIR